MYGNGTDGIRWAPPILYGLLFVAGLSNLAVLFSICCFRKLRTVSNVQVFHICLAGLLYCSGLFFVVSIHILRSWIWGDVMCRLVIGMEAVAKQANVIFVTLAAIERYIAICHQPFYARINSFKFATFVSIAGWLVSAGIMSPVFYYAGTLSNNDTTVCSPRMSQLRVHLFALYIFVFLFLLPTIAILTSYACILLTLRKVRRRLERSRSIATPSLLSARHPTNRRESISLLSGRGRRRSLKDTVNKMILSIIACYLLCWSPYFVINFSVSFRLLQIDSLFVRYLLNGLHMLPYASCGLNPLLYFFLTENFKSTLRDQKRCSEDVSRTAFSRNRLQSELLQLPLANSRGMHSSSMVEGSDGL